MQIVPNRLYRLDFDIPLPVSNNRLQRSTASGRRFNTAQYSEWKDEAGKDILAQRAMLSMRRRIEGHYGFMIVMNPGVRIDLNNALKASIDLMHWMNITDDDSMNRIGLYGANPRIDPRRALVSVWPVGRDDFIEVRE